MCNNKIKIIRKEKGLTLLELAIKANISVGYLCHLENGSRDNPSLEVMEKISKSLDKRVVDVFILK